MQKCREVRRMFLYGTEVTSTNSNNVRNKRFLCYSSDATNLG